MQAKDFNMGRDLRLSLSSGLVTFHNARQLILSAEALGTLRKLLINRLGTDDARSFLMEFGWTCGYSDFLQVQAKYHFDTDAELLASGPVLHSWEGVAKATPIESSFNRRTGDFYFRGTWQNSWEVEQHLCNYDVSEVPTCSTLVGYASGWCSAFMGKLMIAFEDTCSGKGDSICTWVIKPYKECLSEAKAALQVQVLWPLGRHLEV